MAGLFCSRKRADTLHATGAGACQPRPAVPESRAVRRQEGDGDDTGRRRSLSDTAVPKAAMSKTGVGGFLGRLGDLLTPTPAAPRVYYSRKGYASLPKIRLAPFSRELVASYSGPHGGLTNSGPILPNSVGENAAPAPANGDAVHGTKTEQQANFHSNEKHKLASSKWRLRNDSSYGMSLSLYEYKNSDKKECTGDPIADVFAIHTTRNSCVMALADGVGWGQAARKAAQCAVKGSVEYLLDKLYSKGYQDEPFSTTDVFKCLKESLDEAQELIIARDGSLTTLCLAVVADARSADDTTSGVLCVVNVGDSLAFVSSQKHGVREVTVGCREYDLHRNIRFCDGALGPCFGENPDLANLTFSCTAVEEGDIAFLTSDGVSDNFDPVVAKQAAASADFGSGRSRAEAIFGGGGDDGSEARRDVPALTPRGRQQEAARMMGEVLRTTELPSQDPRSAASLCSKLLQHAVNLTERKRAAHEAAGNILGICERERLETQTVATGREALTRHARSLPGKLDHATVVAHAVGGSADPERPKTPVARKIPVRDYSSSFFDVSVGTQQCKDLISLVD